MTDKLTSLTGFGTGDPKPEKGNANWALGGSHAPSRNWGAHKDKTGKNAKSSALNKKMGKKVEVKDMGYGNISHLASTYKRGEKRFKGVSHWSKDPKDKGKEY